MKRVVSVELLHVLNSTVALDDRKLVVAKRIEKRIEFREELREVRSRAAARINRHDSVEAFLARTLKIEPAPNVTSVRR